PEGSEASKRRSSRSSQAGGDNEATAAADPRNSRRLSQNRRSRTPTRNSSTSPGRRSLTSRASSSSIGGVAPKRLSRRVSSGNALDTPGGSGAATPATEGMYSIYAPTPKSTSSAELDAVAKREYEEMLAAVKAKEAAEEAERARAEREMEREEGRRRWRREVGVAETFVHNMTTISDFLSQLLYRRRRQSKRHSRGLPPLASTATDEDPHSPLPGGALDLDDPFLPRNDETPTQALLRVESENEDLALLDRVVADVVVLHSDLVADLRAALDAAAAKAEEETGAATDDEDDAAAATYQRHALAAVGEALMRFATDATAPYIAYAVVTSQPSTTDRDAAERVAGPSTAPPPVPTGGMTSEIFARPQDAAEFCVKVVQRFMGEVHTPATSGARLVTREEWGWYLQRPLKRLAEYEEVLGQLAEGWKRSARRGGRAVSVVGGVDVDVEEVVGRKGEWGGLPPWVERVWRRAERDDWRMGVAAVKVGCVGRAIERKIGAGTGEA
ncbi:hypothetical protein HDU96_006750, partial [Phlyctochytrium bullatum]